MSQTTETNADARLDPLFDAYRKASIREDARAGANVRAAVLAHALVVAQSVAQSSGATVAATGVTNATRATPAANQSRPLWRLAAGVVIGLVGVWIFQLTRPADAPETAVATVESRTTVIAASAPEADKARVSEPSTATAPAAVPAARNAVADVGVSRTRAEANVAIASASPPTAQSTPPAPSPSTANAAARPPVAAAAVAVADAATSEPLRETMVASADLRKSAKVAASPTKEQPATAAASPRAATTAPNAFPAQTAAPTMSAAPVMAASATSGPSGPSVVGASGELAAQSDTLRPSPQAAAKATEAAQPPSLPLDQRDQVLFRAVRAGDVWALRAAIVRGANVNAKDERGRTPLQVARERDDAGMVDALRAAGAR